MRYTEIRMERLVEEMLHDLDKDTVDFQPNYDNSLREPMVLPCDRQGRERPLLSPSPPRGEVDSGQRPTSSRTHFFPLR